MGVVPAAAALCSAPSLARCSTATGRAALIMRRGVDPARAEGIMGSLARGYGGKSGLGWQAAVRACVAVGALLEPPTDTVAHLRLHPPQLLLGLGELQATRLDQLRVHGAVDLRIALQRYL